MKKFLFTGVVILLTALILPPHASLAAAGTVPRLQSVGEKVVIVIDPGHGGKNEGTLEAGLLREEWSPEKEMTLVTAKAMYEELSLYDNVEVYLTRTDDRDLSLAQRAQFAAEVNADFLFSIHYNASDKHNLFGSEVWISSKAPYNAYGYQFGCVQMETMEEMGLFLRGVKTRLSEKNSDDDYYGIIRESVNRSLPAVIIEHCHVDEERDALFCDTAEKWKELGRADALSVAKYFGLKSQSLGVDYAEESTRLPEAAENTIVQSTLKDWTPPDICQTEFLAEDYDTGEISLSVTAADYDSPLIYYDYSMDGGASYSPLYAWPKSNALQGTYADTFTLNLLLPSGVMPEIIVRAYNLFDVPAESNLLQGSGMFLDKEAQSASEALHTYEALHASEFSDTSGEHISSEMSADTALKGKTQDSSSEEGEVSFLTFLKLCLLFVVLLFFFVLVSQYLTYRKKKKQRRLRQMRRTGARTDNITEHHIKSQERKFAGEKTNHKR